MDGMLSTIMPNKRAGNNKKHLNINTNKSINKHSNNNFKIIKPVYVNSIVSPNVEQSTNRFNLNNGVLQDNKTSLVDFDNQVIDSSIPQNLMQVSNND